MPDRHLPGPGGLLRRITPGVIVIFFALVMTACILGVVVWKALEAKATALARGAPTFRTSPTRWPSTPRTPSNRPISR